MSLTTCPQCSNPIARPLAASGRQVCSKCGWSDKPAPKDLGYAALDAAKGLMTNPINITSNDPNLNKKLSWPQIVLLLAGSWAGVYFFYGQNFNRTSSVLPTIPAVIPALEPIVTMAEYSSIQASMSYSEVRAIIGTSGEEMSRVESPGVPLTIMYSWKNPNGSNMNAMFQGDALVTKAQFGFP